MRIANEILDLVKNGIPFTDINIRPQRPLFYRSPSGYMAMSDIPLSTEDISEFCRFADGKWVDRIRDGGGQFDCSLTINGKIRLRCNFFQYGSNNEIGVVIRNLPVVPPNIDQIGTSFEVKRIMQTRPRGLFLVSGPTGSGKSTTLASIIEFFNETMPLSIITIEDPIEYEFYQKKSIIIQREVPTNVINFQKGIESSKRQDPDVIMVGEVRDRETVDAMLTAACSGHLVLATTHARSAQESCEAILSYYSESELYQKRNLLASSLIAVTSQILLPSASRKSFVLCYELMVNNHQISTLIKEGKTREIGAMIQGSNMNPSLVSMNERLVKMIKEGLITKEDALANAYNKENLLIRLRDTSS